MSFLSDEMGTSITSLSLQENSTKLDAYLPSSSSRSCRSCRSCFLVVPPLRKKLQSWQTLTVFGHIERTLLNLKNRLGTDTHGMHQGGM
jgi:hypothetical protein